MKAKRKSTSKPQKKFAKKPKVMQVGLGAPAGFSLKDYMAKNKPNSAKVREVKKEILDHIRSTVKNGREPDFSKWYIGITDMDGSREQDHIKKFGSIKYHFKRYANSLSTARRVEELLCKTHNFKGCDNLGGPSKESRYVYTFRIP